MELWGHMITEKYGCPTLPKPVTPSAEETFGSLTFDDLWQEAGMVTVCRYLRGSTLLEIPDSFRNLLPQKL